MRKRKRSRKIFRSLCKPFQMKRRRDGVSDLPRLVSAGTDNPLCKERRHAHIYWKNDGQGCTFDVHGPLRMHIPSS